MKEKIVLSGFGGQGVMLAGMLLAYAGMLDNREVSWLPSYGPEMRGGTANCHVTISHKPIASPVIVAPSCAIVMNNPSLEKYESQVAPGGLLLVNSSLIDKKAQRTDIKAYYIPANEIAKELGSNKIANMVMLGAYFRMTDLLKKQMFYKALEDMGDKKGNLQIPLNMQAFEKGGEFIDTLMVKM